MAKSDNNKGISHKQRGATSNRHSAQVNQKKSAQGRKTNNWKAAETNIEGLLRLVRMIKPFVIDKEPVDTPEKVEIFRDFIVACTQVESFCKKVNKLRLLLPVIK